MAQGQITLRGRFSPGTPVRLVRVDGEHTLRAEGGEEVDSKTVDDDGCVQFTKGVDPGARYFIVGQTRQGPLEVRARGRSKDDPSEVLENAPVTYDRVRLSDGSWADEPPEQHQKPDYAEGAPHLGQQHVPKGTPQRSDTPRGSAHPVDPEEPYPYPSQEQEEYTKGKIPQMSDTPLGMATPIDLGVAQRQEDVKKGTPQRSDTPTGVATPIPQSGPVEAQLEREASVTKAKRGEPVKAAAAPLDDTAPTGASSKASDRHEQEVVEDREQAQRTHPGAPSDREVTTGVSALGTPVAEDVALASGLEPADPEAERRSEAARKAAETRKANERKQEREQAKAEQSQKDKKAVADAAPQSTSKEKK